MKCPQCHSDIGDDSKFCKECGANISSVDEAKPSFTRTLETPVEELTRGTLFAERYEIIEELGRGGMGAVYRAEDKKFGQEIGLKLWRFSIKAGKVILVYFIGSSTTKTFKLAKKVVSLK